MELVDIASYCLPARDEESEWPQAVKEVMEGFDDAFPTLRERRRLTRFRYRVAARFKLYHELVGAMHATVYTREVNRWFASLVTDTLLSVGRVGCVEIPLPGGGAKRIDCLVRRCREFVPGWYDVAIQFADEEPGLHLEERD